MDGKSFFDHISGLRESLQKYFETRVSYYGLVAFEKAVRLLTTYIGNGVVMLALLIALIFLSGAAAIFVGNLLGRMELGLLIIGGFYLLMALILYLLRDRIFAPHVIRSLAEIFFKDDDKD